MKNYVEMVENCQMWTLYLSISVTLWFIIILCFYLRLEILSDI